MTKARQNSPRPIELLAPAKNADIAIEAIRHGADAVYMGASSHGARAAAGNSASDIRRVVEYAHRFGARVYVTVNTIIYNDELDSVEKLVSELYRTGVDALIVQDMGLLRMNLPPVALHASTQCDIRDVAKARALAAAGFSQLVLARELTLDETAAIHQAVDLPLEAFVHGALCVSYSGDCQAGFATMSRSANRGECPQICRHKFDLTDAYGNVLIKDKHLLSLRDLNRSAMLGRMLEAGISSFKIEGRLKDVAYVKNVVGAYRRMLDEIISSNPDKYRRSSYGHSELTFTPDLQQSFNRGYTEYFTVAPRPDIRMASIDTPKWIGQPVGKTIRSRGSRIDVRLTTDIANGDGLGYFDSRREFHGFRVNKAEGNTLFAAQPVDIPAGTTLYRNNDRKLTALLETDSARRQVDIRFALRTTPAGLALDVTDEAGHYATTTTDYQADQARSPQQATRREVLCKTGDTIYRVSEIEDAAGDLFIPRSILADLRRKALETLDKTVAATYPYDYRRPEDRQAMLYGDRLLTYHDNIANRKAAAYYRDHGAQATPPSMETSGKKPAPGTRVMTTRYCLRREMGRCLRSENGQSWPTELFLQSGPMRFRLEFDCRNCRMKVLTT